MHTLAEEEWRLATEARFRTTLSSKHSREGLVRTADECDIGLYVSQSCWPCSQRHTVPWAQPAPSPQQSCDACKKPETVFLDNLRGSVGFERHA